MGSADSNVRTPLSKRRLSSNQSSVAVLEDVSDPMLRALFGSIVELESVLEALHTKAETFVADAQHVCLSMSSLAHSIAEFCQHDDALREDTARYEAVLLGISGSAAEVEVAFQAPAQERISNLLSPEAGESTDDEDADDQDDDGDLASEEDKEERALSSRNGGGTVKQAPAAADAMPVPEYDRPFTELYEQVELKVLAPLRVNLSILHDVKLRMSHRERLRKRLEGHAKNVTPALVNEFEELTKVIFDEMTTINQYRFDLVRAPYQSLKECQYAFFAGAGGALSTVQGPVPRPSTSRESVARAPPPLAAPGATPTVEGSPRLLSLAPTRSSSGRSLQLPNTTTRESRLSSGLSKRWAAFSAMRQHAAESRAAAADAKKRKAAEHEIVIAKPLDTGFNPDADRPSAGSAYATLGRAVGDDELATKPKEGSQFHAHDGENEEEKVHQPRFEPSQSRVTALEGPIRVRVGSGRRAGSGTALESEGSSGAHHHLVPPKTAPAGLVAVPHLAPPGDPKRTTPEEAKTPSRTKSTSKSGATGLVAVPHLAPPPSATASAAPPDRAASPPKIGGGDQEGDRSATPAVYKDEDGELADAFAASPTSQTRQVSFGDQDGSKGGDAALAAPPRGNGETETETEFSSSTMMIDTSSNPPVGTPAVVLSPLDKKRPKGIKLEVEKLKLSQDPDAGGGIVELHDSLAAILEAGGATPSPTRRATHSASGEVDMDTDSELVAIPPPPPMPAVGEVIPAPATSVPAMANDLDDYDSDDDSEGVGTL